MYLYVRIDAWNRTDILTKNENRARRRETTQARPRPPGAEAGEAGKVRHDEHTAHRMADLISIQVVYGSKTWSYYDFSIAQTTSITIIIHFYTVW